MNFRIEIGWILVCTLLVAGRAWPQTSPPPARLAAPSMQALVKEATAYERDGNSREAARVYEEILVRDPGRMKVISHRLVMLYAELGDAEKALGWTAKIMKDHPDPQAFLAGVHAMLEQFDKAQDILLQELAKVDNSRRKLTLSWQLADVYAESGKRAEAEKVLRDAVDLSKGKPDEKAAKERLRRFLEEKPAASPQPPSDPQSSKQ